MNSEQIDEALEQLGAMRVVPCGAIHESGHTKYGASDCPIRGKGNLACCHPEYPDSTLEQLSQYVELTRRLEQETGTEVLPKHVEETIEHAQKELIILDGQAEEDYLDLRRAEAKSATALIQDHEGNNLLEVKEQVETALRTLKHW